MRTTFLVEMIISPDAQTKTSQANIYIKMKWSSEINIDCQERKGGKVWLQKTYEEYGITGLKIKRFQTEVPSIRRKDKGQQRQTEMETGTGSFKRVDAMVSSEWCTEKSISKARMPKKKDENFSDCLSRNWKPAPPASAKWPLSYTSWQVALLEDNNFRTE